MTKRPCPQYRDEGEVLDTLQNEYNEILHDEINEIITLEGENLMYIPLKFENVRSVANIFLGN